MSKICLPNSSIKGRMVGNIHENSDLRMGPSASKQSNSNDWMGIVFSLVLLSEIIERRHGRWPGRQSELNTFTVAVSGFSLEGAALIATISKPAAGQMPQEHSVSGLYLVFFLTSSMALWFYHEGLETLPSPNHHTQNQDVHWPSWQDIWRFGWVWHESLKTLFRWPPRPTPPRAYGCSNSPMLSGVSGVSFLTLLYGLVPICAFLDSLV